MSLRAIPLILVAFLLYNFVVLFSGWGAESADAVAGAVADGAANARSLLTNEIFSLPMLSGARWTFTIGDLIMLVTLLLLFIEIVKSTYTSTSSLLDHGLSMLVFVACLIEFLTVPQAATSLFFLIMMAALIDVIAGYTIGIRVARRDLTFGGADQ
jgi:hypothetical protein